MNKSELVKALAEKADITQKDAAKALDGLIDTIQKALADGDKVQIIGFGNFEVRNRKERKVILGFGKATSSSLTMYMEPI